MIEQFTNLKEDERNNLVSELFESEEYDKVIELLTSVELESLNSHLLGILGASYNNVERCYDAMEVFDKVPEQERDAKWYYRYAYSLIFKDYPNSTDKGEDALTMLDKACEISQDDEVKTWCAELILYNNNELLLVSSKSYPHLYDLVGTTKSEGEQEVRFCGSILLSEDVWDKEKLVKDLKADWGIEISTDDIQDEDSIITEIDRCRIVISKFSAPVPDKEAEMCAQNNYLWQDAVEVTKTHKAHIFVGLFGDEEDLISKGLLYTKIIASFCKQEKTIGVFTSGVVFEPDYYLESAQFIKDNDLPIFNWIWFGLYRTEKGISAYTYGMYLFGKYELEILDTDEDTDTLLYFLSSITTYILKYDVNLADGETIGFSDEDIHQISLSKGVSLPEQDTLKIIYEKKKKKTWRRRILS